MKTKSEFVCKFRNFPISEKAPQKQALFSEIPRFQKKHSGNRLFFLKFPDFRKNAPVTGSFF